jgi:small basic protein (TIGR04137 family)
MSIDKSLISKGRLTRHRSVLTRTERMEFLNKEGLWEEGQSVFGLPKVRTIKVRKKAKEEKKTEEETAATPSADAGSKEKAS